MIARDYLLRIFDFSRPRLDNYILLMIIDTELRPLIVPQDLIIDGRLFLDMSPESLSYLNIKQETIAFRAIFDDKAYCLEIPFSSIVECEWVKTDERP